MDDRIEITGLDHVEIIAALCNNTRSMPERSGVASHPMATKHITTTDAANAFDRIKEFNGVTRFDYLFGRPIKVDFVVEGDKVFLEGAWLYDRDSNKPAADVIAELRRKGK